MSRRRNELSLLKSNVTDEEGIYKYGSYQTIITREGYEKIPETPFVRMRSANLNLLQTQLKISR
ncbi:hypothetical protein [Oceanobacillus manasiensis]|uniref:hypothetical protein n=1 Tax=Oceanobacillus manasiensis TaxID=586413 RepID=UPI0005AA73AC|nr:hypothetical protein [Oceanobacillus manasiensis]